MILSVFKNRATPQTYLVRVVSYLVYSKGLAEKMKKKDFRFKTVMFALTNLSLDD